MSPARLGTDPARLSSVERDWLIREWERAEDKSAAVLFERMANERNRLQDERDLAVAALKKIATGPFPSPYAEPWSCAKALSALYAIERAGGERDE